MRISERIELTIEHWIITWQKRLKGWLTEVIGFGLEIIFETIEKKAAPQFKPLLDKIEAETTIPPELKPFFDELKAPSGAWAAVLAQTAGSAVVGGALMKIIDYVLRPLSKGLSAAPLYDIPEPSFLTALWLRGKISPEELHSLCTWLGISDEHVEQLKELSQIRLDPTSVITAWRRDPTKYGKLFEDLKDSGWSDDRIEALKFFTQVMPTPRDYVGFLAHEVFEPDMVAKYGLLSEGDKIDKEPAKKIGLLEDELQLYWMDHWEHPEWGTIKELRHRDQIEDQDVDDWFRLVEIPEYWRPKMREVLWGLPNRIEIRMMARYLDMSKEDIMGLLKKAGLHEDFRADAADFMMIMGLTGYWSDMLSKGWMSPSEVKADIDGRGFKPVTAERLYKRLVKASQPEKVTEARDLTTAQIIRWVKLDEVGRRAQGVELLVDLKYNSEQADFIMEGYLGEMGSPETYEDFKDITQKYLKATGSEAKPVPEELKAAAKHLVYLHKEVDSLLATVKIEEGTLIDEEILPEAATARLTELRVALHRAEAELARVQDEYDRLLAEWRHKTSA